MRFRPIAVAAAATALIVLPVAAADAAPTTRLQVRSCQTGDSAKARHATFYARMHAVRGTSRMLMRFSLVYRDARGTRPVPAPQLAHWRRSRPGVQTFGYAQTVTGLQAGGSYAAVVDYRWVDASGKTIRTARRMSGDCRQDGRLPNLAVTRVASRPGDAAGTLLYSVDVANTGGAQARNVLVDLFVDGAGTDSARVDAIDPGETVTVRVSGPVCRERVRAVVDRLDTIHETTEDDNVLRSRCPVLGA